MDYTEGRLGMANTGSLSKTAILSWGGQGWGQTRHLVTPCPLGLWVALGVHFSTLRPTTLDLKGEVWHTGVHVVKGQSYIPFSGKEARDVILTNVTNVKCDMFHNRYIKQIEKSTLFYLLF